LNSTGSVYKSGLGSFEQGKKPSGLIKDSGFLERTITFSTWTLFHEVSEGCNKRTVTA
jgi:hypothetical protein